MSDHSGPHGHADSDASGRTAGAGAGEQPAPRWAEHIAVHLPALRAYVATRVDRLVDAKESRADIVQSVCREVLAHMQRFEHGSETEFRQWLYRTAERKIIDRYRYWTAEKRDATRELPPAEGPDSGGGPQPVAPSPSPSQQAIAREELLRTSRAFDELPAAYREVIVLARLQGLAHAEIARRMGRSEGAVRNLLYRGLAALSDRLRALPAGADAPHSPPAAGHAAP